MNIFTTTNTLFLSIASAYDLVHLLQKFNADQYVQSQNLIFIENAKKNNYLRSQFLHRLLNDLGCQLDDLDDEQLAYFLNALNKLHLVINQIFTNKTPCRFSEDSPRKMNKLFSDKTVIGFIKNINSQLQNLISEQFNQLKIKNQNNKIETFQQSSKYQDTILAYNHILKKFILNQGNHFYRSYNQTHLLDLLNTNVDESYSTGIYSQISKCVSYIEQCIRERTFQYDSITIDERSTVILIDLISRRFECLKKEMLDRNQQIEDQCKLFYQKSLKRNKSNNGNIARLLMKNNNRNEQYIGFNSDERRYLKSNTFRPTQKIECQQKRPMSRVSYNLKQVTISEYPKNASSLQKHIFNKTHSQSSYGQFSQSCQNIQINKLKEEAKNQTNLNLEYPQIQSIVKKQNAIPQENYKLPVQNDFLNEYQYIIRQQMQQFVQEQILLNITSRKEQLITKVQNQYLMNNFRRLVKNQSKNIIQHQDQQYKQYSLIRRSSSENVISQKILENKNKFVFKSKEFML